MSLHTDLHAQIIAIAIKEGVSWPDGTERSTGYPWEPEPTLLTTAEIEHEAYKLDQRERYTARAGQDKRSYALRFATPEALEAHRANARAYEKKKRDEATIKRKAERVNADSALFAPVNNCGVAGSAFASV